MRVAATQASLARVTAVLARTLEAAGRNGTTVASLRASSSVTANPATDLLTFTIVAGSPSQAKTLADAYARAFTQYRQELDTASLKQARTEVQARVAELTRRNLTGSPLYARLQAKDLELEQMETLQTSNATLVQTAAEATKVQPRTMRNAILGLSLGLVLGVALAFGREALTNRVAAASEMAAALDLPLLGRLSQPPGSGPAALVTAAAPQSPLAEAFRVLRTTVDSAMSRETTRSLLITSSTNGEGKSTTAANLAVAFSRSGRSVALVNADLRQRASASSLDRVFGLEGQPGLTDAVDGLVDLQDALVPINVFGADSHREKVQASKGRPVRRPGLRVLPVGLQAATGEFFASRELERVLKVLRQSADLIIVDSPPLVGVGDTLELSRCVDAMLVVVRDGIRRPTLAELRRLLDMCRAAKLGFVLTGTSEGRSAYDYGDTGYEPDHLKAVT